MKHILAGILAISCGHTTADREICYAKAEGAATSRAMAECKTSGWDACPTKEAIQEELSQKRKACP